MKGHEFYICLNKFRQGLLKSSYMVGECFQIYHQRAHQLIQKGHYIQPTTKIWHYLTNVFLYFYGISLGFLINLHTFLYFPPPAVLADIILIGLESSSPVRVPKSSLKHSLKNLHTICCQQKTFSHQLLQTNCAKHKEILSPVE